MEHTEWIYIYIYITKRPSLNSFVCHRDFGVDSARALYGVVVGAICVDSLLLLLHPREPHSVWLAFYRLRLLYFLEYEVDVKICCIVLLANKLHMNFGMGWGTIWYGDIPDSAYNMQSEVGCGKSVWFCSLMSNEAFWRIKVHIIVSCRPHSYIMQNWLAFALYGGYRSNQ